MNLTADMDGPGRHGCVIPIENQQKRDGELKGICGFPFFITLPAGRAPDNHDDVSEFLLIIVYRVTVQIDAGSSPATVFVSSRMECVEINFPMVRHLLWF